MRQFSNAMVWMQTEKNILVSTIQGVCISLTFAACVLLSVSMNILMTSIAIFCVAFTGVTLTAMMALMGW